MPRVPAEKGAILGKDGATGPEGICSLLEFVRSDICWRLVLFGKVVLLR